MSDVTIEFDADAFLAMVRKRVAKRLPLMGRELVSAAQVHLSTPGHGVPSTAPDPPHLQTARLYDSVKSTVDEQALKVTVGTPEIYGLVLEKGTAGGKTIYAKPGKTLAWLDQRPDSPTFGQIIFRKSVTPGPVKARPWLGRVPEEQARNLAAILKGA